MATLEPSPSALAVEENLAELTYFQGCLPGATVRRIGGGVAYVNPSLGWGHSRIVRFRAASRIAGKRLDEILALYRRERVGAAFWAGPAASHLRVNELLTSHGFHCFHHCPGMVFDLERAPRSPVHLRGLLVEILEDPLVFGGHPHPSIGPITTEMRRYRLRAQEILARRRPRRVWHFLARLHGRPVGIATLFDGDGAAGIYDVGVLPSERRKGIGAAVTLAALRFARERGRGEAVLIASSQGARLYRGLGFRTVCRMSLWYTASTKRG